jgi:hypothetical protein
LPGRPFGRVYAASEGIRAVVIERNAVGGQAGSSSLIENYLGFPEGISGAELAERARQQASKFGIEFLMMREGVKAVFHDDRIHVDLADGSQLVARANICATGIEWRRLDLPDEAKFQIESDEHSVALRMCISVGNFNDFKAVSFFRARIPQFRESQRFGGISDHAQFAAYLKKPKEQLVNLVVVWEFITMARVRSVRSAIQWIAARSWISWSVQNQQIHHKDFLVDSITGDLCDSWVAVTCGYF